MALGHSDKGAAGPPSDGLQSAVESELRNLVGETDDPYIILKEETRWKDLIAPITDEVARQTLTVDRLGALFGPLIDTEEEDDPEMLQESLAAISEYIEDAAQKVRVRATTEKLKVWSAQASDPERAQTELLRVVSPSSNTRHSCQKPPFQRGKRPSGKRVWRWM